MTITADAPQLRQLESGSAIQVRWSSRHDDPVAVDAVDDAVRTLTS